MNSKDAYYFSHDANARNDLKISAMISKYGMAGYGQYWIIIEVLRESSSFEIEQKQYTIDALAKQMQCTPDQVQSFIDACINDYALLKSDGEKIWSESLKRRMGIKNEIIEKRRQAAISRWSSASAMQKQCKSNAIKVNESKVKEKKINKIKEHIYGFDSFWSVYPNKKGKGQAERVWAKIKPDQELIDKILRAISWQREQDQWTKDGGKYIPHPTTWLNGRRWEDEKQMTGAEYVPDYSTWNSFNTPEEK